MQDVTKTLFWVTFNLNFFYNKNVQNIKITCKKVEKRAVNKKSFYFLPARRYDSFGPVSVCGCLRLFLCRSQVGVLSKRMNESGWFLAWELPSTYPTLCFKEIQVPSKTRVLPSGTLLQTLDFENFAAAYRSSKRVINLARERWTLRAW